MMIRVTRNDIKTGKPDGWNDPIAIAISRKIQGAYWPFCTEDAVLICKGRDLNHIVHEIKPSADYHAWMERYGKRMAGATEIEIDIPAELLDKNDYGGDEDADTTE